MLRIAKKREKNKILWCHCIKQFHTYTVQKSALSSSKIHNAIGNDPEASHKNAQNYEVASMQGANKSGFFSPQKTPSKQREDTTQIYKLINVYMISLE